MTRGSIPDRRPRPQGPRWLVVAALVLALQASRATANCDSTSFDGSRSYPALGGGQAGAAAVAAGDFDGDRRPDLVVATPETDGVSVFMNNAYDFSYSGAVLNISMLVKIKAPTINNRLLQIGFLNRPSTLTGERLTA